MADTQVLTKPKELHEKIKDALDGRTVMWLHKKIKQGIDYVELTRKVKGTGVITETDLELINIALGTSFNLD